VAAACGVSRHHLAHAFGAATGQPVMGYLRARRLSEAARALAGGAASILDLALESGYGSHEAFSRAFRARFGLPPEAVRRPGVLGTLGLTEPMQLADRSPPGAAPPVFDRQGPVLAAGLRQRYRFEDLDAIPAQWRAFTPTYQARLAGRDHGPPIGVVTTGDDQGRLDYLCAAELASFADLPAGLSRLRIAAADYAVFAHDGHASAIRATYDRIWNHWPCGRPAADAPSIERHNPGFDPATGRGGIRIWIPLA
jgi:AraC family transcriptional regulator